MEVTRWMWSLIATSSVGCLRGDPCATPTSAQASLVLGVGEDGFERELGPGDVMYAEAGPQGGFHVWPAVRTTGFEPGQPGGPLQRDRDVPTFETTLFDDGFLVERVITEIAMTGTREQAELSLFRLPIGGYGTELYELVTYQLAVVGTDVCGVTVEAEQDVAITVDDYY